MVYRKTLIQSNENKIMQQILQEKVITNKRTNKTKDIKINVKEDLRGSLKSQMV